MNRQPLEGTYRITRPEFFSKKHLEYRYEVIDSRDGQGFISPICPNGKETTMGMIGWLCGWYPMSWLEKVS